MFNVISLGAGVQSTTMALMAAHGELMPMPDCAIFADTGDEPAQVYAHLSWLMSGVLPFPVHVVRRSQLSAALLTGDKMARPPLFTLGKGMMPRQCTRNYKLRPLLKEVQRLRNAEPCEIWIGISADEALRMKPSRVKYAVNRWPLIEKEMNRRDCLQWMEAHNYARPPKSSCWHCPYQSDAQWRDKRDNQPDEWSKAVEFDRSLRSPEMLKVNGVAGYLHRQMKPLDEADLSTAEDRGQLDLFNNECEGMCDT